jgi:hypothetical protein
LRERESAASLIGLGDLTELMRIKDRPVKQISLYRARWISLLISQASGVGARGSAARLPLDCLSIIVSFFDDEDQFHTTKLSLQINSLYKPNLGFVIMTKRGRTHDHRSYEEIVRQGNICRLPDVDESLIPFYDSIYIKFWFNIPDEWVIQLLSLYRARYHHWFSIVKNAKVHLSSPSSHLHLQSNQINVIRDDKMSRYINENCVDPTTYQHASRWKAQFWRPHFRGRSSFYG